VVLSQVLVFIISRDIFLKKKKYKTVIIFQ